MTEARLPTHLWISAHLRRCAAAGAFATILRRGDPERGMVLQKLRRFDGLCELRTQSRDMDGDLAWIAAFDGEARGESEADAYISRAIGWDDDLWVIEIESPDGWTPFDGGALI